jgi:hypothetical protein
MFLFQEMDKHYLLHGLINCKLNKYKKYNTQLNRIIFCLFGYLLLSNYTFAQSPKSLNVGLGFDTYHQSKSELYFLSDTIVNYQNKIDSSWIFKQNYQAIKFLIEKKYNNKLSIHIDFRFKLYGVKEKYLRYNSLGYESLEGFNSRFFTFDNNIFINYRILQFKKIEICINTGATSFIPILNKSDSSSYFSFGGSETMATVRYNKIKLGYNFGLSLKYIFSNGNNLAYSIFYSSPFNNNYNNIGGVRESGTAKYWYKWQKKTDAINFSLSYSLRIQKIKK